MNKTDIDQVIKQFKKYISVSKDEIKMYERFIKAFEELKKRSSS